MDLVDKVGAKGRAKKKKNDLLQEKEMNFI